MTDNERAAIIGQLVAMRNVLDGVLESLQEPPASEQAEARGTMGSTMTSPQGD